MSFYWGPKIVTEGLIFYVSGDIGDDSNWNDLSHGYTGTVANPASHNSDGWYDFLIANSDYVSWNAADVSALNFGTGDFSIEILLRISDIGTSAQGIVTKDHNAAWGVFHVLAANYVGLYIQSGSNNCHVTMTDYYDDWVYLTWTVDNTSNIQRSYANGIFDNETSHIIGNVTSSDDLNVGRYASTSSGYLTGDVGNVKMYNRVISDDEIVQNYQATKNRFGL